MCAASCIFLADSSWHVNFPSYSVAWIIFLYSHLCTIHLRACALKPFSLHFFNPSFGLTNLDGRLL
ncbi:hypothetical protein AK812_SmicGene27494, partial [Symbiodinium microadriaticum]